MRSRSRLMSSSQMDTPSAVSWLEDGVVLLLGGHDFSLLARRAQASRARLARAAAATRSAVNPNSWYSF